MKFDATGHKCAIVIDRDLSAGLAMNAASVIGIGFGNRVANLVGPDRQSGDRVNYPGVIYAPLPVLVAPGDYLRELHAAAAGDEEMYAMPFSALAQSCRTYEEYGARLAAAASDNIALVAVGLIGPKKKISRLTGNLGLYR